MSGICDAMGGLLLWKSFFLVGFEKIFFCVHSCFRDFEVFSLVLGTASHSAVSMWPSLHGVYLMPFSNIPRRMQF